MDEKNYNFHNFDNDDDDDINLVVDYVKCWKQLLAIVQGDQFLMDYESRQRVLNQSLTMIELIAFGICEGKYYGLLCDQFWKDSEINININHKTRGNIVDNQVISPFAFCIKNGTKARNIYGFLPCHHSSHFSTMVSRAIEHKFQQNKKNASSQKLQNKHQTNNKDHSTNSRLIKVTFDTISSVDFGYLMDCHVYVCNQGWMKSNKKYTKAREKSLKELMNDFIADNEHKTQEYTSNLRKQLADYKTQLSSRSRLMDANRNLSNKPINEYEMKDIMKFIKQFQSLGYVDVKQAYMIELLCVLSQAVFKINKQFYPRTAQILSVLCCVNYELDELAVLNAIKLINSMSLNSAVNVKDENEDEIKIDDDDIAANSIEGGLLLQVGTGQGKSLIVALLSCIQSLMFDSKVDISTSSKVLAQRESRIQSKLFDCVNLKCGFVDSDLVSSKQCKRVYKECDTVFGTTYSYHCHLLHEQSPRNPEITRDNREFGCKILDECDSMLIDSILGRTQLSSPTPGYRSLSTIFVGIWQRLCLFVYCQGIPVSFNKDTIFLMSNVSFEYYLAQCFVQNMQAGDHDDTKDEHKEEEYKDDRESSVKYLHTLLSIVATKCFAGVSHKDMYSKGNRGNNRYNNTATILALQYKYNIFRKQNLTAEDVVYDLRELFLNDIQLFLQLLTEKAIFGFNISFYHYLPKSNELTFVTQFINGMKPQTLQINDNIGSNIKSDFHIAHNLENGKIFNLHQTTANDFEKHIKNQLQLFVSEMINATGGKDPKIFLPKFVKEYLNDNCSKWIDSAWDCLFHHCENNDYIVDKKKNEIKIVDFDNTGLIQPNMKWSHGKHEFLQLKHGLKLSTLGNTSCVMSNTHFFGQYKKIYGLTGTLGDKTDLEYYKTNFKCDYVKIPSFARNSLQCYPSLLCVNGDEWLNTISMSTISEAIKGRVVLIIAETIDYANRIENCIDKMRRLNYNHILNENRKIYRYSNNTSANEMRVVERLFDCGDIIVATNIAGRGTDIKYTNRVLENQGLHVIITFVPKNSRVEKQNIGRTARAGLPGTSVMIVNGSITMNGEQFDGSYSNNGDIYKKGVAGLIQQRNTQSCIRMHSLSNRISQMNENEKYYNRFLKFCNNICKEKQYSKFIKVALFYQWSLTYEKIQECKDDLKKQMLYNAMIGRIRDNISKNKIFSNDFFNIWHIITELDSKDKFRTALQELKDIRDRLGNDYGAIPQYWRAYIQCREYDCNRASNCDWDERKQRVNGLLAEAVELFAHYRERTVVLKAMLASSTRKNHGQRQLDGNIVDINDIGRMLNFEIKFIEIMIQYCTIAMGRVDQLQRFQIAEIVDLDEIFDKENPDISMNDDLCESYKEYEQYIISYYRQCGMVCAFKIKERQVKRDWFVTFTAAMVAVVGVLELVFGVVYGHYGFVRDGIEDIFAGIMGLINNEMDFEKWFGKRIKTLLFNCISFGCKIGIDEIKLWWSELEFNSPKLKHVIGQCVKFVSRNWHDIKNCNWKNLLIHSLDLTNVSPLKNVLMKGHNMYRCVENNDWYNASMIFSDIVVNDYPDLKNSLQCLNRCDFETLLSAKSGVNVKESSQMKNDNFMDRFRKNLSTTSVGVDIGLSCVEALLKQEGVQSLKKERQRLVEIENWQQKIEKFNLPKLSDMFQKIISMNREAGEWIDRMVTVACKNILIDFAVEDNKVNGSNDGSDRDEAKLQLQEEQDEKLWIATEMVVRCLASSIVSDLLSDIYDNDETNNGNDLSDIKRYIFQLNIVTKHDGGKNGYDIKIGKLSDEQEESIGTKIVSILGNSSMNKKYNSKLLKLLTESERKDNTNKMKEVSKLTSKQEISQILSASTNVFEIMIKCLCIGLCLDLKELICQGCNQIDIKMRVKHLIFVCVAQILDNQCSLHLQQWIRNSLMIKYDIHVYDENKNDQSSHDMEFLDESSKQVLARYNVFNMVDPQVKQVCLHASNCAYKLYESESPKKTEVIEKYFRKHGEGYIVTSNGIYTVRVLNSKVESSDMFAIKIDTHGKNIDRIYISFCGTRPSKVNDVAQDWVLATGYIPFRLKTAMKFTNYILSQYSNIDKENCVFLTGHSLGGFIAEQVAYKLNLRAYTFNAPNALSNGRRDEIGKNIADALQPIICALVSLSPDKVENNDPWRIHGTNNEYPYRISRKIFSFKMSLMEHVDYIGTVGDIKKGIEIIDHGRAPYVIPFFSPHSLDNWLHEEKGLL